MLTLYASSHFTLKEAVLPMTHWLIVTNQSQHFITWTHRHKMFNNDSHTMMQHLLLCVILKMRVLEFYDAALLIMCNTKYEGINEVK